MAVSWAPPFPLGVQESFTEMNTDTTHFLPKDQFLQESDLLDTKMMLWFKTHALTRKETWGFWLVGWFGFFCLFCLYVHMFICFLLGLV